MVFYFSGTGNTRWAAQELTRETGEELLYIPHEMKGACQYTLKADERLGFCFPVHGWQPPKLVRQFIRRATFIMPEDAATPPYCFALVTCGDSIGRTMELLQKELKPRGVCLDSMFSLVMPESYVCLPFMKTDSPERERNKLEKAAEALKTYIRMVADRLPGEVHTRRGLTPWTFTHVIGAYFNRRMVSDRKFTVDADVCTGCGRCQQVCPTGDVRLDSDRRPQWQHDGSCTCCLSCYHHCPQHAINYGRITRKRGQYYFGHTG